jgi:hypothetical protein
VRHSSTAIEIDPVRRIVINTVHWRMRTRPDSVDDDHGQHSAVLSASLCTSFESASAPAAVEQPKLTIDEAAMDDPLSADEPWRATPQIPEPTGREGIR